MNDDDHVEARRPRQPGGQRQLHMRYAKEKSGWRVSFSDLHAPNQKFREIAFASSDKIVELVTRTETKMILEVRQAFELGIRNGLGAIPLTLTTEQYRKLVL